MQLVGKIFGTEEEKNNEQLEISKEEENEINESDSLKNFRDKRSQTFKGQFNFLKNQLNKNKSPFIIKASIQGKNNNEDNIDNQDLENNIQNNKINKNNKFSLFFI